MPPRPIIAAVIAAATAAAAVFPVACKRPEPKVAAEGDRLKSFIIENAATGALYCQVCAFAGKPIIMAVGDPADPAFQSTLSRVQALVAANAAGGLRAFAVAGVVRGGELQSFEDAAKAAAELRSLETRLGLAFPLTHLPKQLADPVLAGYSRFNEAYALAGPPMVLFANAESRIMYRGVPAGANAEAEMKRLAQAIAGAREAAPARDAPVDAAAELAARTVTSTSAIASWAALFPALTADALDARGSVIARDVPLSALLPAGRAPSVFAFWGTFCAPCLDEMTMLDDLHARGYRVAGVSLDTGNVEAVASALRERKVHYPNGVLTPGSLRRAGLALESGLPFTLLLDTRGALFVMLQGELDRAALLLALARARDHR